MKHLSKSFVEIVAWLRVNWFEFSLDINTKMLRLGKATRGYGKHISLFIEDVHPSVVTLAEFWAGGHLTRFSIAFTSLCSCILFLFTCMRSQYYSRLSSFGTDTEFSCLFVEHNIFLWTFPTRFLCLSSTNVLIWDDNTEHWSFNSVGSDKTRRDWEAAQAQDLWTNHL